MKKYFKFQIVLALLLILIGYGSFTFVPSDQSNFVIGGDENWDAGNANTNKISNSVRANSQNASNDEAELPDALRSVYASTQTELNNALSVAIPGDHILLSNGNYSLGAISRSGTEPHPIVIPSLSK